MINSTTLSVHDMNQVRAAVLTDNAEGFDREVGLLMNWYAWDESERAEAVAAWLAAALYCFEENAEVMSHRVAA